MSLDCKTILQLSSVGKVLFGVFVLEGGQKCNMVSYKRLVTSSFADSIRGHGLPGIFGPN